MTLLMETSVAHLYLCIKLPFVNALNVKHFNATLYLRLRIHYRQRAA